MVVEWEPQILKSKTGCETQESEDAHKLLQLSYEPGIYMSPASKPGLAFVPVPIHHIGKAT